MNIVYIHTHDSGRYIEPYGYHMPTPNLMKLAKEGVLFRQAFCAGPTCSPSRTALLSGMAPHSAGLNGLTHLGFQMNDYSQHLVQFLKRNGYETALSGIQHEAPDVASIGYDRILGNPDFDMAVFDFDSIGWDMHNARAAADFVREKRDQPFFLSFGMFNTHLNFPPAHSRFNPNYVAVPHPLADTEGNREMMAGYLTSVDAADACVGIVLQAIAEAGIEEETLIIFTTDHGLPFPHMKCNLYDTGIGVSLMMKTPLNYCKGEAVDALVSHLDLFPTICDLAGLDKPEWLQGRSLLPLLTKEATKVREEIFAEVTYHVAYEPMRCIRTDRYKYIRYFDDEHEFALAPNIDNTVAKRFLIDHGMLERKRPKEMLFDLYLDPVERVNLCGEDAYADIRGELEDRLTAWMRDTNDPLLNGPVPPPERQSS